ncbi:hypothetical protein B7463_g332, partial [Scytalidium lignicola]
MLSAIGRAAIRRLGVRTAQSSTNRLAQSSWPASRVHTFKDSTAALRHAQYITISARSYAAAASVASKKPKTKSPAASKAKSTKKSGTKKAATKTPTAKTKKPAKKELTEEQKQRLQIKKEKEEIKKLKEIALFSEPKSIVDSAWGIVLKEHMKANAVKGAKIDGTPAKEASEKYKSLSPSELEQYNHEANENKTANAAALKQWVESYTPDQIRLANNARKLLTKRTGKKYHAISDERAPKRPRSAYLLYTADRWASGDMKGIPITETASMIHDEWKRLPANEKKVYEDRAIVDKERYEQEVKTAFP